MVYTLSETLAVAKAQKGVLWCIIAHLSCVLMPPAFIVVLPFQMYYIYKLALALKARAPVLWVIGMFLPLISIFLLLILSQRATAVIREAGFKVGLMGAKVPEIESKIGM